MLVIALAVSFPFYLNTYGGVRGVDAKIIEAGQVFGLSRTRLISLIILPAALPSMLVGLRGARKAFGPRACCWRGSNCMSGAASSWPCSV